MQPHGTPTLFTGLGWRQPHYAQVLQERPALDFLEVHSENFFGSGGAALNVLEQGRAAYPISLHGVGLSLGSAIGLDEWHLAQLVQLVERIEPVRVSDHASFARGTFRGQPVHTADLLPLPFHREALSVLAVNVQCVQDRLKRPILVENISAYVQWHTPDAQMTEPDFLNTLTRETGCSLLVDINNIYVNARNAQLAGLCPDPVAACQLWIEQIRPDSVGEVHLAGHCHVNDASGEIVIDDHGSRVVAPVWDLYRHAVARFGNVPTLIEWDTDVPSLAILLEEVSLARHHAASVLGAHA